MKQGITHSQFVEKAHQCGDPEFYCDASPEPGFLKFNGNKQNGGVPPGYFCIGKYKNINNIGYGLSFAQSQQKDNMLKVLKANKKSTENNVTSSKDIYWDSSRIKYD